MRLSVAVLALGATAAGLGNRFTQDELPLILKNEAVHTVTDPVRVFRQSYWHDPFPPALYRPLATTLLGVQWVAGGGRPVVFRWGSVALLIAAGLCLLELARLILPAPSAWAAAALFVVHPVHVEATAPAVNQGELAVGLLSFLAVAIYIAARRRGAIGPRDMGVLVLLYLAGALFKENALVLPGLFLAAEFTVLGIGTAAPVRSASLRPLYLLLALTAAAVLAARAAVLGGNAIGAPPSEALAGSSLVGRALTMLAVAPQWARLLFWPAHLQADYGPNEIVAANGWGPGQWAGLLAILAWLALVLGLRRRSPGISFGLLWMAVAILPVSNLLVATSVTLGERTLFLASGGAALALGGAFGSVWSRVSSSQGRSARTAAIVALIALLALGVYRSSVRDRVWRSQETLLRQTVRDAPRSYAAHLAMSRFLEDSGNGADALSHYREAVALKPALPDLERNMADQYRMAGFCEPAVRHYRRAVAFRPQDGSLRSSLVACLLRLERYPEARAVASPGLGDPGAGAFFKDAIRKADSAMGRSPVRP